MADDDDGDDDDSIDLQPPPNLPDGYDGRCWEPTAAFPTLWRTWAERVGQGRRREKKRSERDGDESRGVN